jgi:hypothetical protein
MIVTLNDNNLQHVKTFGSQHIEVSCTAELKSEGVNGNKNYGKYLIRFYRDPISGNIRSIQAQVLNIGEIDENTLSNDEVKDIVHDYLDSL